MGATALHHWTLDTTGGLTDQVGDWNLTAYGSPTTGATGMFGEAYSFDGSDDILNATASGITGNWTFCYWLNPANVSKYSRPLSLRDDSGGSEHQEFGTQIGATDNSDMYPRVWFGDGSSSSVLKDDSANATTSTWYFICETWDGTNQRLWINGTDKTDATPSISPLTNPTRFSVGADTDTSYRGWVNGTIDEPWIFNDALTSQQINNLKNYNDISGTTPPAYGTLNNTYTTPVYETNTTSYQFSIWTNTTNITSASAILYWNSTAFTPTVTNSTSGTNQTWVWDYNNFTLPLVQTNNTAIAANWQYNLTWANGTITQLWQNNTQNIYYAYYWADYYPDTAVLWGEPIHLYANITDLLSIASYNLWALFNNTNYTLTGSSNPYTATTTAPNIAGNSQAFTSNATLNVTYTSPTYGGQRTYQRLSENETITVYKAQITDCSIGTNAITYTGYNETDVNTKLNYSLDSSIWVYANQSLNGYYTVFSSNNTGTDHYTFCIYPAWATVYVNSWQEYGNTDTNRRAYFLDNATVSNSTSAVGLYMLSTADDQLIQVTLKDEYASPYADAYLYFNRYYVAENTYRTVAMCKTDENGQCNTYLAPNDVWYRIQVIKDHDVKYTFSPQTVSCDTTAATCTLSLSTTSTGSYGEWFDYNDQVAYSCNWNNATNVTSCTVTDTSGLMKYARLIVKKEGLFTPTTECDTTASGASVTLICPLTNPNGNYAYTLVAHFYDEQVLTDGAFTAGSPDEYGNAGLFASAIMVIAMGLIGAWSAPVAVILSIAALVLSAAMHLVYIQYAALVAIAVVGGLIAFKMR